MQTIEKKKTARLEARIPNELKENLELAASVSGYRTVNSFLVHALQESADRIISDYRMAKLDAEQSKQFAESLLNPKGPNEALKEAFQEYKKTVIRR